MKKSLLLNLLGLFLFAGLSVKAQTSIVDPTARLSAESNKFNSDIKTTRKIRESQPSVNKSGGGIFLNQNLSSDLIDYNYIGCHAWGAGGVRNNAFSRVFDLSTYTVGTDSLELDTVYFGLGDLGGRDHPIVVSYYELVGPYLLSNLTLINQVYDTILSTQASHEIIKIPLNGVVSTNAKLVVEIFTPTDNDNGRHFLLGHNNYGETGDSYLLTAECGLYEPGTLASIGFGDVNYVIQASAKEYAPMQVVKTSVTPESCPGSADGLLSVAAAGGAEPYKFSLDGINYKFGASFTGLAAGKYVVYAKDANGVIAVTDSITVGSPTALSAYIVTIHHVTCYSGADGGATINIQGGTPPYTYKLGGITTVGYSIQQSKAGTFSPTVTDAKGCVLVMDPLTINQPSAFSLNVTATDFPTCGDGLSGAVSAVATGGTAPYTYFINGVSNGASGEISDLGIGTHVVSVLDVNGCALTASPITFTGPSLIGVGSVVVSNAVCNGSTGSLTVTATGDVTGVQYALDAGAFQSSNVFTGVAVGEHVVRVKNSFACEASATATVAEPMAMQLSAKVSDYKSCTGNAPATITLKGLGGQPPFAYRMGAGGFQSSNVFPGLDAGSYSFTIVDANGCSARVFNVKVDAYEPLEMSAFAEGLNNCVGSKNGRVVGVANGGQAPFSYFLSGVGTQTTGVFNNLASGSYVMTITDALQCTVQSDTLTIAAPVAMDGGLVVLNGLDCADDNDGILQGWASGGVVPYTYSLDGVNFTSESVFTNLSSGSYRIYAKDANGCLFVSEGLNLISPAFMNISAQVNPVDCNGDATGSIVVNVVGGNPPYQYATSSQGPWGSDKELSGLSAGAQHVFVRGANGCVQFYGVVDVPEAEVLSLTATTTPEVTFKDGGIQMKANGGTAPYHYYYYAFDIWNSSLNPNVNWLAAGTYLIAIVDNSGCTDTTTVIVDSEVGVEELEGFDVKLYPVPSAGVVNLEMNDTPLKLEVLNNLGAVMYVQTQFDANRLQLDLSNLAKGMYQIRVSSQLNTKVLPLLLQ